MNAFKWAEQELSDRSFSIEEKTVRKGLTYLKMSKTKLGYVKQSFSFTQSSLDRRRLVVHMMIEVETHKPWEEIIGEKIEGYAYDYVYQIEPNINGFQNWGWPNDHTYPIDDSSKLQQDMIDRLIPWLEEKADPDRLLEGVLSEPKEIESLTKKSFFLRLFSKNILPPPPLDGYSRKENLIGSLFFYKGDKEKAASYLWSYKERIEAPLIRGKKFKEELAKKNPEERVLFIIDDRIESYRRGETDLIWIQARLSGVASDEGMTHKKAGEFLQKKASELEKYINNVRMRNDKEKMCNFLKNIRDELEAILKCDRLG
jgi:hypothetical protein